MDELAIHHETKGNKGSFFIEQDGERVGELTYTRAGATVILDHTEVGDALRGQSAGKKLVRAAVDWARRENQKLLPLCPFARATFDRDPSLHDVLAR